MKFNEEGKFYLIWTIIWLLFISFMCFIFKSAIPCWFIVLWMLGF